MAKKMVKIFFIIIIIILVGGIVSRINWQQELSAKDKTTASFLIKFQMKDLREDFSRLLKNCPKREAAKIQRLLKRKDEYEVYVKFSMLADNVRVDAEKTIGGEPGIINFSQTKTATFTLVSEIVLTVTDESDEFSMNVDYMFFEKIMNKDGAVKVSLVKSEG